MFISLLRQIDLFGKPVKLNFNGKEKSKSLTGACFSFLFFGFVLWAIYQVGRDIIFRLDPKVITSESFSENPESMLISPDTFNFAFGLEHPTTFAHYINESIYTVDIKHNQLIREIKNDGSVDMKWRRTPLALERCATGHFGPLGPSFENIELKELYCLKKDQPGLADITIQGVFESSLFQDISISFKPCDPGTSQVPCAPQETLDKMLGAGYFAIYYTNKAVNPKNYDDPIIGYRDSYFTSISNTYMKEIFLSLNHLEVKSDIGWITKDENIDKFIKVDSLRENINFRATKTLLSFILRVGKITTFHERSYTKVQDIFAQANGLATAGLIFFFVLLAPYSNVKFYERLINELFDIKAFQSAKKKKNKQSPQTKLIRKKSSIKSTYEESPKLKVEKLQKTLNGGEPPENTQIINLSMAKNAPNLIDENNKDLEQPTLDAADQPQMMSQLKRVETFHESKLDDQSFPAAKSPDESSAGLNFNKRKNLQERDRGNPSYTNQPLQQKPKAIQPQIKVLEHYDTTGPADIQTILENLIDQQEHNTKKLDMLNEESQQNEMIDPNMIDAASKPLKEKKVSRAQSIAKSVQEDVEDNTSQKAEELPCHLNKETTHINISFGEYICSHFWKSSSLKEKFGLLEEGMKRIEERLDIFNVLKKFREVDKLKLLLLENEQYVLFDTLPKPELILKKSNASQERKSFSHSQLKEAKFISEKRKNDLVAFSYKNLKKKAHRTMIDEKLLEIYDSILAS